ncbi:MAG: hypothetical protein KA902_05195, partial [Arenimonas sp.]|nr:hypothetical protein [Arenimonas sp.]
QQAPVRNELPLFASVFDGVFETQQEPCVISIEQLKAFWQRPMQHLAKSKGIRLQRDDLLLEENEPYGKLEGLDAYQLEQRIFDNALQSTPATDAELTRQLQAEGLLAPGRLGLHTYHAHAERLVPAMTTLQPLRIEPITWQLDLALSHARVQGELLQYYANGLIYNRGSKPMRAKDQLRSGFDALLARACDFSLPCFNFTKNKLTQRSMPFTPHQAQQALEVIVALYREGETKIICFDAEISFAFYQDKIKNPDLDVHAWLLDTQAKENEDYTPAFDQSIDFLTYGQGFISEIAMKNPLQFESLAMHIFRPIMGVARDD